MGCGTTKPKTILQVRIANGEYGKRAYTIHCDPAGGTVPRPKAVCAALKAAPRLLRPPRNYSGHCPGGPEVRVRGSTGDTRIDAPFAACTGGNPEWIRILAYGPEVIERAPPVGASDTTVYARLRGVSDNYPSFSAVVWHLRVVSDGERTPAFEAIGYASELEPFRLPPGRYAISTFYRPCINSCDQLDEPNDPCKTAFVALPHRRIRVTIEVDGYRCSIRATQVGQVVL